MAKQRTDKTANPQSKATDLDIAAGWSFWVRLAVSVLVCWHLFAVFISPFAVFSDPPASPLVTNVATSSLVRWYSEPMYLAGGYQFFSPDPPRQGRLIRYSIVDAQGNEIARGEIPNRANESYDRQWPRLWYHRHMMLADQIGDIPLILNADGTLNEQENNRMWVRAYGRHLLRKHGGTVATLEVVRHFSLFSDDAWPPARRDPARREEPPIEPTDPRLYELVDTVQVYADQLEQPLLTPVPVAQPEALPSGVPTIP